MKKIIITTIVIVFSTACFAQCTEALAAAIPTTCNEIVNSYKYIGTNGKENKANTLAMYIKLVKIYSVFDTAFKKTTGLVGKWRAQVDDKNNEGLVKGLIQISMQAVTCKENGEYIKSTNSPNFSIYVHINNFPKNLVKDKKKQPNFILDKEKTDSLNGRTVYYISVPQQEEKFRGMPLHFYNWDTWRTTGVIITKPNLPLFNPISIGDFLTLFKKWTTSYNAVWKGNPRFIATPEDIDKFTSKYNKEFLNKPMIYVWDGGEQVVYVRKTSYADDVTQGKQWVTINPDYLGKNFTDTSIQYISLEFDANTKNADPSTTNLVNEFKTNFDFKKLQALLDK